MFLWPGLRVNIVRAIYRLLQWLIVGVGAKFTDSPMCRYKVWPPCTLDRE
jgi:hypothetical protein